MIAIPMETEGCTNKIPSRRNLPFDDPEPGHGCGNVDAAIGSVGAPGETYIDPREEEGEQHQGCEAREQPKN